jgi:hypothetical protein
VIAASTGSTLTSRRADRNEELGAIG